VGTVDLDDHRVHVRRAVVNRAPSDIALVLAEMPDVVEALIREHTPDERGLCRACGTPGTGTPHLPWPCPLRVIADTARRIRAGTLR
jgi:hypothetical protein